MKIRTLALMIGVIIILRIAFNFGNSTNPNPPNTANPPCHPITSDTLYLTGQVDRAMRDCALALLAPEVKNVIVNSEGGDVFLAHEIGYRIGQTDRHVIVEKYCLSSCANYFIPAAKSVELKAGAVIGLHGTPDPQMLDNTELQTLLSSLEKSESETTLSASRLMIKRTDMANRLISAEKQYAAHFNIPLGWRLYRTSQDTSDGWRKYFINGTGTNVIPDKFMIVENIMLNSCLPNVETNDFQNTLENSVFRNTEIWADLKLDIGAYRSYDLACI